MEHKADKFFKGYGFIAREASEEDQEAVAVAGLQQKLQKRQRAGEAAAIRKNLAIVLIEVVH
jgi:hypothetical protein